MSLCQEAVSMQQVAVVLPTIFSSIILGFALLIVAWKFCVPQKPVIVRLSGGSSVNISATADEETDGLILSFDKKTVIHMNLGKEDRMEIEPSSSEAEEESDNDQEEEEERPENDQDTSNTEPACDDGEEEAVVAPAEEEEADPNTTPAETTPACVSPTPAIVTDEEDIDENEPKEDVCDGMPHTKLKNPNFVHENHCSHRCVTKTIKH